MSSELPSDGRLIDHGSKPNAKNAMFTICCILSICLVVGGFFCPPIGIIDGSVLTAGGELLAFAALAQVPEVMKAVRNSKSITFTKGDLKVDVSSEPEDRD